MIKYKDYFEILDTNNINLINNNKSIQQPSDIKLKLKNYQKSTIYNMYLREKKSGFFIDKHNFMATNLGILGEGVGSGKTFITLGLISLKKSQEYYYNNNPSKIIRFELIKKKYKNINNQFFKSILNYIPKPKYINVDLDFYLKEPHNLHMNDISTKNIKNINSNLIVLPHNLIQQWRDDIKNHTTLTYYYISNIKHLRKIEEEGINILSKYNIVLCNASKYNYLAELTKNYIWERIFFDEAHSINIPKSEFMRAKFYWFITATYKSIIGLKNTGFLRKFVNTFRYRLRQKSIPDFNKFILKTNVINVKKEFLLEKPEKIIHLSLKPMWVRIIEGSIDHNFENLTEMMYAELDNEIKNYLVKFYSINVENKNVILTYLEWLYIREHHLDNNIQYYNNLNKRSQSQPHSQAQEKRIDNRKKSIEKYTIKKNYYNSLRRNIKIKMIDNKVCWICLKNNYTKFMNKLCNSGCIHRICYKCESKNRILGNNCFFCINKSCLTVSELNYNEISHNISKVNNNLLTKMDKVLKLINDDKRLLIFSNYTSLFNKYLEKFKEDKIKFGILKGNNNVINKRIRDFKSGKINVLLLNGRFCGSGLNLQDASDIIITHKIKKDIETQIIGRANRMGRKGKLKIHYLAFEGEFNTNIDNLSQYKIQ